MKNKSFTLITTTVGIVLISSLALADGDADKGEKVFAKKCQACHSEKAVSKGTRPSLVGISGSKAGATDFKKYKGLKDSDIVWTDENLDRFLADPIGFLGKKTSMRLKIKESEDRDDVIAYLKTLK